jgi:hypothetical protein
MSVLVQILGVSLSKIDHRAPIPSVNFARSPLNPYRPSTQGIAALFGTAANTVAQTSALVA